MNKLIKTVSSLEEGINRVVLILMSSTFLIMLTLAVLQVIMRKFLMGWVWVDSLNRTLVVWVSLMGAILATREDRHITTEVVVHFLPKTSRLKTFFSLAVCVFLIFILSVTTFYAWQFYLDSVAFDSATEIMPGLSKATMDIIYPVGFFFIGLNYIFKLPRIVASLKNPLPQEATQS